MRTAAVLRVPAGRFPFMIRRIRFKIYKDSIDFRRAAETSVVGLGTEPTCLYRTSSALLCGGVT
jgi:hypothetical protein